MRPLSFKRLISLRAFISVAASITLVSTAGAGCSDADGGDPGPGAQDGGGDATAVAYGPLGEVAGLPVDGQLHIDHLAAPVDVVRDKDGRPHIYASSVADAMRVQGYLVAQDRTLQLELVRRNAAGRVAELFGSLDASTIDADIAMRTIGLARVAKAEYDALPPGEDRDMLDAYADGVTQVFQGIRSGKIALPRGVLLVPPEAFTDWTGADSLAVGKLQSYLLSYDATTPIRLSTVLTAAQSKFVAAASNPLFAKRAGFERDFVRFAPSAPAFTTTGYPGAPSALASHARPAAKGANNATNGNTAKNTKNATAAPRAGTEGGARTVTSPLLDAADGYLQAARKVQDAYAPSGFGSNNWAVSAARSTTGHPLIASDPHLALRAPATFWPVSVHVGANAGAAALSFAGVAFPGVPGILLGHNDKVAWGATVAYYQVTDVYSETLSADGRSVSFGAGTVPLQTIDEIIGVGGGSTYTYHVQVVPQHGPLLPNIQNHRVVDPNPATGALSVRWTGLDPTKNFSAVVKLLRASSVDGARAALNDFAVGAQNWMIGDSAGNILWTSHARVPTRDPRAFAWNAATYTGRLPCFVLPGNGGAEWTGNLADDLVPWAKNPPAGYLATANNDPIGDTADNDPSNGKLPDGTPMYLSALYDIGFREARIKSLIESHKGPLSPTDMAAIQADVRSSLGAALTPRILQAIDLAEAERTQPGTHPDLGAIVQDRSYDPALIAAARSILQAWDTEAGYQAASGIDPDTNQPLSDQGATAQAIAARASQATLIFNVWLVRMLERTFGDEFEQLGLNIPFGVMKIKSLLHLFATEPSKLATLDPTTRDSSIWDDMNTAAVESRNERIVRALLDAFAWLTPNAGTDLRKARWGAYHTVQFTSLISLFGSLSIPPSGDTTFPNGFPRSGDLFVVDASDYEREYPIGTPPRFQYTSGPVQRFVADLDPAGIRASNALPGGAVWDTQSPHHRDQAELWRRNQTHPVPYALPDLVANKESRTVVLSP
ncbi:penicillin acylase family protein [Pendulispora albinea]|uniref:Penicillin acylase family protein n=1 Tax=Pendulispora albinea TaxID=2741071 RepID=A0ABZ2MA42_9BACT